LTGYLLDFNYTEKQKRSNNMNSLKGKILAVLVVLIIAVAAYGVGAMGFFTAKTVSADQSLFSSDTVTSIFNNVNPAVVEIDISQSATSGFFGRYTQQGEGSGFIIDSSKGYILTNNHVVDGASNITVKMSNGNTAKATVVGTDSIDDLALVSVDASVTSNITALTLGDSSALKLGQMAIAIGSPMGYQNTVTVGVVSGLNRTISGSNYTGMVQTDAAINPGNSGGPLLDENGAVIGINTAVETGAQGIGFAVASNTVKKALGDLEAGKQVQRPWIGISGMAITSSLATSLNLSVQSGIYVVSVVADSPADTAGLVAAAQGDTGTPGIGGDVITAVDGKSVAAVPDLSSYIANKSVGDTVTLSILRNGSTQDVQVTLGARPANVSSSTTPQIPQMPNFPGHGWRVNPGN
jgi:S1-C subfamily serine protease